MSRAAPAPIVWISEADVRRRLGISPKSLRALRQTAVEAGIEPAWVDVGNGRPKYRWDAADVDRWIREVGRWRASQNAAGVGSSAGTTQTERDGGGRVPTSRRRSGSRETSSGQKLSVHDGSPRRAHDFRDLGS